jgi:hypothetical protein
MIGVKCHDGVMYVQIEIIVRNPGGEGNYLVGQEGLDIGTALGILCTWNQVIEMRETLKLSHSSLRSLYTRH